MMADLLSAAGFVVDVDASAFDAEEPDESGYVFSEEPLSPHPCQASPTMHTEGDDLILDLLAAPHGSSAVAGACNHARSALALEASVTGQDGTFSELICAPSEDQDACRGSCCNGTTTGGAQIVADALAAEAKWAELMRRKPVVAPPTTTPPPAASEDVLNLDDDDEQRQRMASLHAYVPALPRRLLLEMPPR